MEHTCEPAEASAVRSGVVAGCAGQGGHRLTPAQLRRFRGLVAALRVSAADLEPDSYDCGSLHALLHADRPRGVPARYYVTLYLGGTLLYRTAKHTSPDVPVGFAGAWVDEQAQEVGGHA